MNKLTRGAAGVVMFGLVWVSPLQALAQPLPGSLVVTITSPTSGSTVAATITVSASVSPAGALVAGVQFKLDEADLGARGAYARADRDRGGRSEEHTSELQSLTNLVCRLLL